MDNQDQGASSTENAGTNIDEPTIGVDELTLLKQRATLLGVHFSNNIGLETLKERVRAKQEALEAGAPQDGAPVNPLASAEDGDTKSTDPEAPAPVLSAKLTARQKMVEEQMKLVRCRIQNLDPKKKDLHGEILCVGNEILGMVKMFVPFGEVTDGGWHIPQIILTELQARQFQNIRTRKDPRTGQMAVENGWAKEFAIDILEPLTEAELKDLATAQAAAGSIG